MIRIIYGPKGSGKTKKIIKDANDALDVCKGSIVYITDNLGYSKDVNNDIRFICLADYGKFSEDMLKGFIRGVMASNTDVSRIYIDGTSRITGVSTADIEDLILDLDGLSAALGFDLYMTVTAEKLPAALKKYAY